MNRVPALFSTNADPMIEAKRLIATEDRHRAVQSSRTTGNPEINKRA